MLKPEVSMSAVPDAGPVAARAEPKPDGRPAESAPRPTLTTSRTMVDAVGGAGSPLAAMVGAAVPVAVGEVPARALAAEALDGCTLGGLENTTYAATAPKPPAMATKAQAMGFMPLLRRRRSRW